MFTQKFVNVITALFIIAPTWKQYKCLPRSGMVKQYVSWNTRLNKKEETTATQTRIAESQGNC